MKSRIICLGNRLLAQDSAGTAVFDCLQQQQIPPHIELIDGGTAGLNLLPLLENGGRIVFVDAVSGFTDADNIIVLNQEDLINTAIPPHFGHEVGLSYVLSVLDSVCDGPLPEEILIVGLEGRCETETVVKAARLCLSIATEGLSTFAMTPSKETLSSFPRCRR